MLAKSMLIIGLCDGKYDRSTYTNAHDKVNNILD